MGTDLFNLLFIRKKEIKSLVKQYLLRHNLLLEKSKKLLYILLIISLIFLELRGYYYGKYVSEHASKINDIELITIENVDPMDTKRNTLIINDKSEIESIINCLEFRPGDISPCGFDYEVSLYRMDNSCARISINSECGYFTSNVPELYDISTDRNFYSFSGPIRYALNKYINNIEDSDTYIYFIECSRNNTCENSRKYFETVKNCVILSNYGRFYNIVCSQPISREECEITKKRFQLNQMY